MGKVTKTLKNKKKFWNLIKNEEDTSSAELQIYGEIASEESWWSDVITPQQFKEDLNSLGDLDELVVRINSPGGDVFAASAIYTLLKDSAAQIIVKVDGFCASAATIIAMAGDEIQMSPAGMFMIHDPLSGLLGYYNAQDLREVANTLDKVKESIMNAYTMRTDKTQDEITSMMSDSTWLTADEALDEGFIDKIMFQEEEEELDDEAVFDGKHLIINKVSVDISKFKNLKSKIIKNKKNYVRDSDINSFFNTTNNPKPKIKEREDKKQMDIKTVDDLKKTYPDLVNEIQKSVKDEATKAERERLQAIDEISKNLDDELVNKAKYTEPMNAEKLAFEAIKNDQNKGQQFLKDRKKEVVDSGTSEVDTANNDLKDEESEEKGFINKLADCLNKRRDK